MLAIVSPVIHPDHSEVALATLGVIVTGLLGMLWLLVKTLAHSRTAADEATAANQAVNNTSGPGEHRLYDKVTAMQNDLEQLVEAQDDFTEKGWRSLPDDIATAVGLTEVIRDLQHEDLDITAHLHRIETVLVEHVARERARDQAAEKHRDGVSGD